MANDPPETAARDAAENRAATLRGSLEDRPIPRLLHDLFRKQVTGQLLIIDDCNDESRLYLRDGAPVHLERPNDIDRLDQVLIETGLVSQEVIRNLSATLQPGKRLGEALIERGMVSAKALGDVLKVQMRRKLMRLFFPRKGQFAIYVEAHPFGTGGEFGEMRVDPRCLLYQGIRSAYDDARLEAELTPLKTLAFRLLPTLSSSVLEAMGFGASDPTIKALGERMLGLADLPVPGAKRMDSLSVVLALLYTDVLETAPLSAARTAELPTQKPATGPTPTVSAHRTMELPTQRPPAAISAARTIEFPVQKPGSGPTPTVNPNRTMELPTRKPPAPAATTAPPPRDSTRLPDSAARTADHRHLCGGHLREPAGGAHAGGRRPSGQRDRVAPGGGFHQDAIEQHPQRHPGRPDRGALRQARHAVALCPAGRGRKRASGGAGRRRISRTCACSTPTACRRWAWGTCPRRRPASWPS